MATKEAELFVVVGADVGPLKRAYAEAGNVTQVFGKQIKQQADAIEDAAYEEFAAKQRLIAQAAKEAAARRANMTAAEREAAAIMHSAEMSRAAAKAGILGSKAATDTAVAVGEVAKSATRAGVGLNGLRSAGTSLLAHSLQLAPGVGQVSSVLGTMAIGTPMMIGVLAGASAIAAGWHLMTKEAKELEKATSAAMVEVERIEEERKTQGAADIIGRNKALREGEAAAIEKVEAAERALNDARSSADRAVGSKAEAATRQLVIVAETKLNTALAEQKRIQDDLHAGEMQFVAHMRDKRTEQVKGVQALTDAYRELVAAIKEAAFARSIDPATVINSRKPQPTPTSMFKDSMADITGEVKVPVVDRTTEQVVARMQEERRERERQDAHDAVSRGNLPAEGTRLPLTRGEKAAGAIAAGSSGPVGMIVQAAQAFGPFAALMPIVNGFMEKLAPVVESLMEPLEIVGGLIGSVVVPVLKFLVPPLKLLATVSSYVVEGLGGLLKALGKAINWLLPGNPANRLVNLGKEMQAGAKEAREALKNVGKDVEDAGQRMAESMSSVPLRFNAALERYQIATGATGRTASPRSTGGGGVTITGPITIVTDKNDDPRALWDKFMRGAKQAAAAGDPQARAWAAAAARRAFA